MSHKSGSLVFTSYQGTSYLMDKYLSPAEFQELRNLNDGFHNKKFEDYLLNRLAYSAGSNFIPGNYYDEIIQYARARVGSNVSTKSLKTSSKDVDVITTYEGKKVYYLNNERSLRDYETGRFTKAR